MSAAQVAIDDALAYGDPRNVTDAVKDAVAHEIGGVNSQITVRKTEYFNHSYIPDMVAWWGPGDEDRREVFLRFDAADPHLAEDIERLDREHPMFFSLTSRKATETSPEITDALSRHRQVMVTGADALDALGGSQPESFESLISTAIVQSGRGFIDEELATRARADTSEGLAAALLVDESRTWSAISTARRVLTEPASRRVEKYLQMLWLAGGGELDGYPGSREVGLDIGSEDVGGLIRLILSSEAIDNPDYWHRLGPMVTLNVLEGLESVEPSTNLQRLVNSNAERLQVSYAAASGHAIRLTNTEGVFSWFIADSRLCLDGPEWTITFSDDGRHFRGVKKDRQLLAVEEVTRRAAGFVIEAVGLDDENLVITVETKDSGHAERGVAVSELANALGVKPRVRSVTVRNGASINVEFDRLVAGLARGRIALPLLAEVAVSFMTTATVADRDSLRSQLSSALSTGSLLNEQ